MKSGYRVLSVAILVLGIIHIAATPVFYKSFAIEAVWFVGGGLVLILTALLNFMNMRKGDDKTIRYICHGANGIGLLYTILIATALPKVQAYAAVALMLSETAVVLRLTSASE